jgi:hypothetical protein
MENANLWLWIGRQALEGSHVAAAVQIESAFSALNRSVLLLGGGLGSQAFRILVTG